MGNICNKQQNQLQQNRKQIDFEGFILSYLQNSNEDFCHLLCYLSQLDVLKLVYIVKGLFDQRIKAQIHHFVSRFQRQIKKIKPPPKLLEMIRLKQNKIISKKKAIITSIQPYSTEIKHARDQKAISEVFSRSIIDENASKQIEKFDHINLTNETHEILKKKEKQIQQRLQRFSQALKGIEKLCELESFYDQRSREHSVMQRSTQKNSFRAASNYKILIHHEDFTKKSFKSMSPQRIKQSGLFFQQKSLLKVEQNSTTMKVQQKFEVSCELPKKLQIFGNSRQINIQTEQEQDSLELQKHLEIKEFYEGQISRYKVELQTLRNKIYLIEKSFFQNKALNLVSIDTIKNKSEVMRICSQSINKEVKPNPKQQTTNYGTKINEFDSSSNNQSENGWNERKHAKSMIIRMFRESKIFPVCYSKISSTTESAEMRDKIEDVFRKYYTAEVYDKNPIEITNMIFEYEQRQPKRFYDYIKNYKTWVLVGKVNQSLYVGAFVNLKQGKQGRRSMTKESFLFSLPREGDPYILRTENEILDPIAKPDYINFGDSEFRIRSGTRRVNLNFDSLRLNFSEENGEEPSTRKFSMGLGHVLELEQLQIHEVIFSL